MNNNFGDLSNKIAEVHPMRIGTIATLRHGMHNNACLAIIPRPTYLLTAAINAVMMNSPSWTDDRWLHTEIPSSSQHRRGPTTSVVARRECCHIS